MDIREEPRKWTPLNKYSYVWVTAALFFISLVLHWTTAWYAYKDDQQTHHAPVETKEYVVMTLRDTMENWQSEFLQLIWQVAGLSFLFFIGSSTSKEGDDRREAKMDYIMRKLDAEEADKLIKALEKRYPKK